MIYVEYILGNEQYGHPAETHIEIDHHTRFYITTSQRWIISLTSTIFFINYLIMVVTMQHPFVDEHACCYSLCLWDHHYNESVNPHCISINKHWKRLVMWAESRPNSRIQIIWRVRYYGTAIIYLGTIIFILKWCGKWLLLQ